MRGALAAEGDFFGVGGTDGVFEFDKVEPRDLGRPFDGDQHRVDAALEEAAAERDGRGIGSGTGPHCLVDVGAVDCKRGVMLVASLPDHTDLHAGLERLSVEWL